VAVSLFDGY